MSGVVGQVIEEGDRQERVRKLHEGRGAGHGRARSAPEARQGDHPRVGGDGQSDRGGHQDREAQGGVEPRAVFDGADQPAPPGSHDEAVERGEPHQHQGQPRLVPPRPRERRQLRGDGAQADGHVVLGAAPHALEAQQALAASLHAAEVLRRGTGIAPAVAVVAVAPRAAAADGAVPAAQLDRREGRVDPGDGADQAPVPTESAPREDQAPVEREEEHRQAEVRGAPRAQGDAEAQLEPGEREEEGDGRPQVAEPARNGQAEGHRPVRHPPEAQAQGPVGHRLPRAHRAPELAEPEGEERESRPPHGPDGDGRQVASRRLLAEETRQDDAGEQDDQRQPEEEQERRPPERAAERRDSRQVEPRGRRARHGRPRTIRGGAIGERPPRRSRPSRARAPERCRRRRGSGARP